MTARLATGRNIQPRLVHTIDGVVQPYFADESLGLNENDLRRIRASMYDVVNHERGTAYGSRIVADEARMAGKTGTSQVRRITPEERARGVTRNEDLPWERRDHALWVNFAPLRQSPLCRLRRRRTRRRRVCGSRTHRARHHAPGTLRRAPPLEAYPSNVRSRIQEQQERIEQRISSAGTGTDRA